MEAFRAVFGQADGVPPTFLTAAEFTVFPRIIGDPALDLDFARVLHGGQEYELARPLREGETLTVRPRIESIRVRAGTGFLVIAMDLFDALGNGRRADPLDDDRAEPDVTRRLDEVTVGEELPELRRVVTREDVKAYADASGDQNPLHQSDEFARGVGFDDVIAHGMFTMGHMAACVVAWAGDAAQVSAISAQFRATVSMGQEIVAGGRVRAVDAEAGTATVDLWVSSDRDGETEWPIKRGGATVRLA